MAIAIVLIIIGIIVGMYFDPLNKYIRVRIEAHSGFTTSSSILSSVSTIIIFLCAIALINRIFSIAMDDGQPVLYITGMVIGLLAHGTALSQPKNNGEVVEKQPATRSIALKYFGYFILCMFILSLIFSIFVYSLPKHGMR